MKKAAAVMLVTIGVAASLYGCGSKQKLENEKAYRQTGISQLEEGDYEGAVESFNQALNERTGKVTNLEEDINFYKAFAQMEAGRTKDAIETYTALVEYDEKNAGAWYLRGCAYISVGNAKQAAEDFRQAAKYNSDSSQMYAGIYEQLVSVGMLDEAADYLDKGLKIKGDGATDYLSRGRLYLASGAYEKAVDELKQALDKKEPSANLYLGDAARALGNKDEASSYYQVYAQEHPEDSKVLYALGEMEFEDGAYEQALSYFEQGMAAGSGASKQQLWSGKIAVLENMGDFSGAKKEMESYLESYPEDETAQREYVFLKTR